MRQRLPQFLRAGAHTPQVERVGTVLAGQVVERLLYVDPATKKRCHGPADIPFYQRQQRFVLRDCGFIDPASIEEYQYHGGYAAARKALLQMSPEQICQEITKSGETGMRQPVKCIRHPDDILCLEAALMAHVENVARGKQACQNRY